MATSVQIDWIEKTTADLLAKAKRSGYFAHVIEDAICFEKQGYVWDVALKLSCNYWCS
jgi:hypothetical protein